MAEGKKGFILYADIIHTIKKLSLDKRGKLFTTILEYVNDENPEVSDILIDLVFEPIKRQLKRDLCKYESRATRSRENGAKGGRPKKPKKPSGLKRNPEKPRKPDTVNVNVNDTVTDTVNVKDNVIVKEITKRWFEFYEKRTGIKPSFDGIQGKSLKSIIKHIEKQQKEGQKTEDTFQFILDRWNVLDDWLQSSCLDLKILNSKINVVLDQIKNGTGTKKGFTKAFDDYNREHDPNYHNY